MALTESRKRANAKWNKENLRTLGCTVSKETAEAFKAKCNANGLTVNAVLVQFVNEYLKEETTEQ